MSTFFFFLDRWRTKENTKQIYVWVPTKYYYCYWVYTSIDSYPQRTQNGGLDY